MASVAPPARKSLIDRWLPDRVLGALAWALLAVVIFAVARGHDEWDRVSRAVWFHLGTIAVVLALTPVMLTRRKGDRRHRQLGWIWAASMCATALFSLVIRPFSGWIFSPIALLSIWALILVPRLILQARAHDVVRHRSTVRGLVIGALLIAGFFTFPFNRMLGQWLFG
jgi:uncharacterized membrane protein